MAIPDFQTVMLPLMEALADGRDHHIRDLTRGIADRFGLSEEERALRLPSGQQTIIANRVGWAKTHLKMAGLLENPSRGAVRPSALGGRVLGGRPARIDQVFLRQFPGYPEFRKSPSPEQPAEPDVAPTTTPQESIGAAYRALRSALAKELLERVRVASPGFFEETVVELLVGMGYGGSLADAGRRIGRSGDGGVDGLIKEDRLGLDVIAVQAKRWEGSVGRPVVQGFVGSMDYHQARKGVLLTTSTFTAEAYDYVGRIVGKKVVLIDGEALAELMIDHGVGVAVAETYVVKKVDSDYFDEDGA